MLVEREELPRRDPTELRLADSAYGAGRIGGVCSDSCYIAATRGFVEQPTVFTAIYRVGEANGDASRSGQVRSGQVYYSAEV